jgi:hypothetical protein
VMDRDDSTGEGATAPVERVAAPGPRPGSRPPQRPGGRGGRPGGGNRNKRKRR